MSVTDILVQSPVYENWDDVLLTAKSKLGSFRLEEVSKIEITKNLIRVYKQDDTFRQA